MSSLNLSVLKRHDPAVSEIVEQPAYVHLYKYADGSWAKTGIEGTLLLFRRSRGVAHGFFILNRNGLENFSADLTSEDDVELNDPLIIINPPDSDEVHGIYVTDKDRSASIGQRMLELGQLSRSASEINLMPPPKQSTSKAPPSAASLPAPSQPPSGADLLAMLTQSVERQAPKSHAAPTAAVPDQQRLLDKLFSKSSPAPPPTNGRPGHQRQSSEQTLEDIKAAQANGQMLLQRLGVSPQPVQHHPQQAPHQQQRQPLQQQQQQARSPPAIGLVPRRVSDRNRRLSSPTVATAPLPPIATSAPPPAVPESSRPPQTPVDDLDATASKWSPPRNDDGSVLSSRDYTEPAFVEALYQRYLSRIAPTNGAR